MLMSAPSHPTQPKEKGKYVEIGLEHGSTGVRVEKTRKVEVGPFARP